jgi:hypothetical protein
MGLSAMLRSYDSNPSNITTSMHPAANPNSIAKCFFALAALTSTASAQVVLTQWTFELSLPTTAGPFAAEVGTGQALGFHANGATVYSNPAGNISAESFSSNTWSVGDYYQFSTSTTGLSDIGVTWDQTGSSTGPRDFKIAYSTDGTTFTDFAAYAVLLNGGAPNATWGTTTGGPAYSYSYDLSAVTALDNASSIFFRLIDTSTTAINGSPVATGGTNRVDNFTVLHSVPEPTTAISVAGGLAMLLGLRRSRRVCGSLQRRAGES